MSLGLGLGLGLGLVLGGVCSVIVAYYCSSRTRGQWTCQCRAVVIVWRRRIIIGVKNVDTKLSLVTMVLVLVLVLVRVLGDGSGLYGLVCRCRCLYRCLYLSSLC